MDGKSRPASVSWTPRASRNTDTADSKGYDAGKKVSGIKRHIAVDTQGLPHGIHVTTADVTDRAGALAMFDENRADLSQVQKVLVDGGYTGKPFATAVQGLLGASVEVVKRKRTAHLRGTAEAMGGGAVFRLAGKVPPTLEELRKKAQYQPATEGEMDRGRDGQRERWKAVQKARRKGMSLRAIERELGIHRSTVRSYLEAGGPPGWKQRMVPNPSTSDTMAA